MNFYSKHKIILGVFFSGLLGVLLGVPLAVVVGVLLVLVVLLGELGSGSSWCGCGGYRRETVGVVVAFNESLLHLVAPFLSTLLLVDHEVVHPSDHALHLPQLGGQSSVQVDVGSHPLVLVVAATTEAQQES